MGVKGYAIHLSFSPGNGVLMRDNTPKSTRTQGGDPIADYIRADTRLPAYLPYPRFLLKMEISQTAKLLYSLLLDRSTLSQKNKWLDDEGRIYIIYPIAEIAEILDKGSTTIKGALNELDTAGLLERERGGFSAPNRLYVKVPPVPQVQFSDQLMAGSPPLIEPENRPTDGQKTDLMMVGKPSPNQTTINNLTESQTKGVSGGPSAPYGRYGNIFLSQTEYDELQAEYPDRLERFIEEMSRYLAANGKSYQNYAAALRIWAGNDKNSVAASKCHFFQNDYIFDTGFLGSDGGRQAGTAGADDHHINRTIPFGRDFERVVHCQSRQGICSSGKGDSPNKLTTRQFRHDDSPSVGWKRN